MIWGLAMAAVRRELVTLVLVTLVLMVHQTFAQGNIVSFTGPAGPTCVTSSGFLGNCVSPSSCRIGGATSVSGCARSSVCCLRVSGSSGARSSAPRPPVIRPTSPPQRRLCTYRVPVTSSGGGVTSSGGGVTSSGGGVTSSEVGLFARSARGRRSPQRSRANRRRSRPRPRPSLGLGQSLGQNLGQILGPSVGQSVRQILGQTFNPNTTPPQSAGGVAFTPETGPASQGAGLIGVVRPSPRPVGLNNVLDKIQKRPVTQRPVRQPVARPVTRPVARPVARPVSRPVTRPVTQSVTSQSAPPRQYVSVSSNRPPPTPYRTYVAYC